MNNKYPKEAQKRAHVKHDESRKELKTALIDIGNKYCGYFKYWFN